MRFLVAVVVIGAGCAEEAVGVRQGGLVGGTPTTEYPAVLLLETPAGGLCTGALVAPEVVLTAAHCQIGPGATAWVMSYDQPVTSEQVVEVVSHRYHDGGDAFSDHDLALARLAGPLPVDPLPVVTGPLAASPIGKTLGVIGFGVDDGVELTGAGAKRVAAFSITAAVADHMTGGESGTSICFGDSGGPALLSIDGVATIVGVTRSHSGTCRGFSQWTRVDTYAREFVLPYVDAWSGPCRFDGACVTEACRTPDPDCAPCGVDGTCSTGCDALDLDCPVAAFYGDECGSSDDCESRRCIDDPHGERGPYCTRVCDDGSFCPSGSACEEADGALLCLIEPTGEEGGGCAAAPGARAPLALALLALLAGIRRCRGSLPTSLAASCRAGGRGPPRSGRPAGTA